MNKSMIGRLRTAAGYQRQAIRALLPEGMDGHLDVIEKEIKAMAAELIAGAVAEYWETAAKVVTECGAKPGQGGSAANAAEPRVKKVTID